MTEPSQPSSSLAGDELIAFFPANATRNFTDAEIEHIASVLKGENKAWSTVPRMYIVLRKIGRLDILEDLLEYGLTDYGFPVEASSLPPRLDPSVRTAIVEAQSVILTKSMDLEKGTNGRHRHFGKDDRLPFTIDRKLGGGATSQVDLIRSTISFKEYALKRIPRRATFRNRVKEVEAVRLFCAEMRTIKALKHRHIVEFVGSYTGTRYLGLLMSPVAQEILAEFMDRSSAEQDMSTLRSFFGCLATATEYLHDRRIRHRDIKPQNILVNGINVLLTDFGFSKDYSDVASTTSGMTVMTRRYAAPEVLAGDSRSFSADIWSLGCVFIEMIAVLKGYGIDAIRSFLLRSGTKEPYISRNPEAALSLFEELQDIRQTRQEDRILDIAATMLDFERSSRPTAAEVLARIITPSGDEGWVAVTTFCGICCLQNDIHSETYDGLLDNIDDTLTQSGIMNSSNLDRSDAVNDGVVTGRRRQSAELKMADSISGDSGDSDHGHSNPTAAKYEDRQHSLSRVVVKQTKIESGPPSFDSEAPTGPDFLTAPTSERGSTRAGCLEVFSIRNVRGRRHFMGLGASNSNVLSTTRYFWLGEDRAISTDRLVSYLWDKRGDSDAARKAAWASTTGKGLLFSAAKNSETTSILGIIQLAEVSRVTARGKSRFTLKLHGDELYYIADNKDERDLWVAALSEAVEHAKEAAEGILGKTEYIAALIESYKLIGLSSP